MDTLAALEWDRFLEMASECALTQPGYDELDLLFEKENWARNIEEARLMQAETQELLGLIDRDALWGPLRELGSPFEALEALRKGITCDIPTLALYRRWLYAIDSWATMPRDGFAGERFKRALSSLMDAQQPIRLLERILTPEGELSEKATPKLFAIHNEIRAIKREIGSTMENLVRSYGEKGVLQEQFSDVHDGRYVIPVRISAQNEVEGNIYGASASRQTVFIEPKEIAHSNNRLRSRQIDLQNEIQEILEATSRQLRPFADEIEGSVETVAHWDAAQAKARFSRKYGGKTLQVGEGREFKLTQTAHPLLWWSMPAENITRNDLGFGEPVRTLLLTGPNTGGKTVLLKTLGLAGVCARTGFPFPGAESQIVPFFDAFFVDVGDSQSIEEHLSSFSGHIQRFKHILNDMSANSLVLLDELNSATDPAEGAALGRAFLETVMARGAIIVATTHDPQLKALALGDKRILNASMAFDEKSRSPTYTMLIGVPGRSRALETAERLGLPREILVLARSYLTEEHRQFEGLIERLEKDAAETDAARRDANRLRDEAARLEKEWREKTEKDVSELMERTRQKLRKILEQAQDEVRTSVRKLDDLKSRREIDQTRGALNESLAEASDRLETALREEAPEIAQALKPSERAPAPRSIEAGQTVRVPKWKNLAQVLDVQGNKIKVQMGSLTLTLGPGDVEMANAQETQAHRQKLGLGKKTVSTGTYAPTSSLDLRGKRFEEAMTELEQYLDLAYRSGELAEVTIVHGLGTGAIREGTKKLLKKLPYIKEYRDGGAGLGGSGATIVEFDR